MNTDKVFKFSQESSNVAFSMKHWVLLCVFSLSIALYEQNFVVLIFPVVIALLQKFSYKDATSIKVLDSKLSINIGSSTLWSVNTSDIESISIDSPKGWLIPARKILVIKSKKDDSYTLSLDAIKSEVNIEIVKDLIDFITNLNRKT